LRNIVVSFGFGAFGARGECSVRNAVKIRQAFGRSKPILANVNATGTVVSDRVHVGEIVVISRGSMGCRKRRRGQSRGISPDRLPCRNRADISAALDIGAYQGRDHGD
jgi:hypothetical protein